MRLPTSAQRTARGGDHITYSVDGGWLLAPTKAQKTKINHCSSVALETAEHARLYLALSTVEHKSTHQHASTNKIFKNQELSSGEEGTHSFKLEKTAVQRIPPHMEH